MRFPVPPRERPALAWAVVTGVATFLVLWLWLMPFVFQLIPRMRRAVTNLPLLGDVLALVFSLALSVLAAREVWQRWPDEEP